MLTVQAAQPVLVPRSRWRVGSAGTTTACISAKLPAHAVSASRIRPDDARRSTRGVGSAWARGCIGGSYPGRTPGTPDAHLQYHTVKKTMLIRWAGEHGDASGSDRRGRAGGPPPRPPPLGPL